VNVRQVGVRLFARAGRGIRLTDEGERFALRVRNALTELADAVREVADRSNPRLLRISVTPSFAARWLLPRMGRFAAAHPGIDLDVRASGANVDFQRDDAEVAVRYGTGQLGRRHQRASARRTVLSGVQSAVRASTAAKRPGTSRAIRCCAPRTNSGSRGSRRRASTGRSPIAGRSSTTLPT
jgi:LysR family glycine cleavage system transcriptional activator